MEGVHKRRVIGMKGSRTCCQRCGESISVKRANREEEGCFREREGQAEVWTARIKRWRAGKGSERLIDPGGKEGERRSGKATGRKKRFLSIKAKVGICTPEEPADRQGSLSCFADHLASWD